MLFAWILLPVMNLLVPEADLFRHVFFECAHILVLRKIEQVEHIDSLTSTTLHLPEFPNLVFEKLLFSFKIVDFFLQI